MSGITKDEAMVRSSRIIVLIIAIAAVCIVLPLLLRVKEITDVDTWLFLEVRESYETDLKMFMRIFTELGSFPFWFMIIPLLWLARKKEEAATLLIALLMIVLIVVSMKYAVERPRPYDVIQTVDPLYRPFDPSFPSAHAMNAFAGAVVIGKRWRKALIILLYLAAAIAYSRVYIGVHYPFDVVSGAIIGVLIGLLACNLDGMRLVRWTEGKMQNVGDAFSKGRNAH